ncbi:MAG: ROK family protein [Ruminococcaceae bacterium]|nr:ROK family protein [Oscillospiraceae bacterium]
MYLGIDIGGTKCALVLGKKDGTIVRKVKFDTADVNTTLNQILESAVGLCQASPEAVESIGVSCGGPLDSRNGVILSPPNLPGWDKIEITRLLREATGLPAYLCNDANACALAEWKYGAGVGTRSMIFLTFGTGMGAGLVLDGKLYSGASDMAGEIGHVRIAEHGPVGYGKSGSFEGFCSGSGIAQIGRTVAMELFQQGKTPSYCDSMDKMNEITAKSVAIAARDGHEDAVRVYDICAEKLGAGLAILVDVLNPERIVLGSIYMRDSALLCDKMQAVLRRETLPLAYSAVEVVPAKLEENIGDIAALTVAAEGHTWAS